MPDALCEAIRRALAVDPAERYASAEELADALEAAMRAARTSGGRSDVAIAVRRMMKQRPGGHPVSARMAVVDSGPIAVPAALAASMVSAPVAVAAPPAQPATPPPAQVEEEATPVEPRPSESSGPLAIRAKETSAPVAVRPPERVRAKQPTAPPPEDDTDIGHTSRSVGGSVCVTNDAPQPIVGTDTTERNVRRTPMVLPRRPIPSPTDRHKRPTLPGMPPIEKAFAPPVPVRAADRPPSEPTVDGGKNRPLPDAAFPPGAVRRPREAVAKPVAPSRDAVPEVLDARPPSGPVVGNGAPRGKSGRIRRQTDPGPAPVTAAGPATEPDAPPRAASEPSSPSRSASLPLPAPPPSRPPSRTPTPVPAPAVAVREPTPVPVEPDILQGLPSSPPPRTSESPPVTTTTTLSTSTVGRRLALVFGLLVVLVGAYFAWQEWGPDASLATAPETARVKIDAGSAHVTDAGHAAVVPLNALAGDAGLVAATQPAATQPATTQPAAMASRDAGAADAGAPHLAVTTPSTDGKLSIASTPAGATVYLDGAAKGQTPLELPASGDRLHLTLVRPGYRLYKSEIDGGSKIAVTLEEAPALKGPAGIKVSCASHDRIYVIVDGQETGRLCPTEQRIPVVVGAHTVELYDPVTDATSKHAIDVKGTHFSARLTVKD